MLPFIVAAIPVSPHPAPNSTIRFPPKSHLLNTYFDNRILCKQNLSEIAFKNEISHYPKEPFQQIRFLSLFVDEIAANICPTGFHTHLIAIADEYRRLEGDFLKFVTQIVIPFATLAGCGSRMEKMFPHLRYDLR